MPYQKVLVILFTFLFLEVKFLTAYQDTTSFINGKRVYGLVAYVSKPVPDDITCIKAIARAKKDISNGKVIVGQYSYFLGEDLRYERELSKLCREEGLRFKIESISCIEIEGQTEGCYTAYMDRYLMEAYGNDFRKNLERTADSLFVENLIYKNRFFPSWKCESLPYLIDDDGEIVKITPVSVPARMLVSGDGEVKTAPYVDIELIIEKDGSISNMYLADCAVNPKSIKKYGHFFLREAKKLFMTNYSQWFPAEILLIPVRSDHTVRVYLVPE